MADAQGEIIQPQPIEDKSSKMAMVVYVLYLASFVIPFVNLIGLIMAYINKGDASPWVQTHYRFQIRTFWISFLYCSIGGALTFIFIGYLVLFGVLIWYVIRMVIGLKYLSKNQAVPDPASWMFG